MRVGEKSGEEKVWGNKWEEWKGVGEGMRGMEGNGRVNEWKEEKVKREWRDSD